MLCADDLADLPSDELADLAVVPVSEHETDDIALEMSEIQRGDQFTIGRNPLQRGDDHQCRTAQEVRHERGERTLANIADAEHADEPALVADAVGIVLGLIPILVYLL